MASQRFLCLFLLIFTGLICTSHAYRLIVGGRDGWVVNPSENYNHWAGRMRFQVNDTLFFKYKKGSDSVLVVNKDDYDKCNTEKPITKMDDGDSVFKFDRSGPFFFISGNKGNCQKGQKLIIVVLAVRNHQKSPPAALSPAPVGQTPALSPSTGSSPLPAPATTPMAPSPMAYTPTLSPATSPISPSPVAIPPVSSPAPAMTPKSPSPSSHTPVPSPTPTTSVVSPAPAPAVTPVAPSPANFPASPTVSPSAAPTIVTPSPSALSPQADNSSTSGNPTADIQAPEPTRSSAPAFTHSVVLVLIVALGSFISAY